MAPTKDNVSKIKIDVESKNLPQVVKDFLQLSKIMQNQLIVPREVESSFTSVIESVKQLSGNIKGLKFGKNAKDIENNLTMIQDELKRTGLAASLGLGKILKLKDAEGTMKDLGSNIGELKDKFKNIKSNKIKVNVKPDQLENVTKEIASQAIRWSEQSINETKEKGFPVVLMEDNLLEAKRIFEQAQRLRS